MRPFQLKRFFNFLPNIGLLSFILFSIIGLYYALIISPPDYLQGDLVRILYIHVPCAWLGVGIYAGMGICSMLSIIMRSAFYAISSQSLALPGFILTSLCIITGSIWGKAAWGTWWVWDARLTSVVVLWIFYLSYLNLCNGRDNRAASFLNIVGLINLPIIKWSVDWWFTLHQPSTFNFFKKSYLDSRMLPPLILITIAMSGWVAFVFAKRFFKIHSNFKRYNQI